MSRLGVQSDFSRIAVEQRHNPPKLELASSESSVCAPCRAVDGKPEFPITGASSVGRVRAPERE